MTSLYVLIYYFSVFKFFFQLPANIKQLRPKCLCFINHVLVFGEKITK